MKLLLFVKFVLASLFMLGAVSAGELTILHINDHHSHLRADSRMSLKIGGEKTRVRSGGFPAVVSMFNLLSEGRNNVLKLHAGDAITGDLYYTLFKGEADAALMNEVCFDAFAIGNQI
jgi:5'-nucleotidase